MKAFMRFVLSCTGCCTHSGPHGTKFHGKRGGGWCYFCSICNPNRGCR